MPTKLLSVAQVKATLSELLRPRPSPTDLGWVETLPREDQLTSAVCVGVLFKGTFRSQARDRHLANIENRMLPAVTVLPCDISTARVFGRLRAHLEEHGRLLPDADIQIAATAFHHGLQLVTGNLGHFRRIPGLRLDSTFAYARRDSH